LWTVVSIRLYFEKVVKKFSVFYWTRYLFTMFISLLLDLILSK
jgi:hypothetical protein